MKRVLLTGVIGPYDNIQFDLSGDRLTRDQDIFTLRSHFHYIALHFLAQNIDAPCVVLEHPNLEDLEEELEKGYDFVGINFTLVNVVKMLQMCEAVRRVSPETKIVLGGYGTSCFRTIFKGREEALKVADYVCHGEGVSFLRKLLGEPLDAPLRQIVGPRSSATLPWLQPYAPGTGGFVVSGLGCPNMCEFCCTSAYYGGEFIELARAEGLFEGMKRIWRCRPESRTSVGIFDENLYKDKDKVSTLGKLIREDEDFGMGKISYFSFGTIEDLSRYDVVEDLVMNGVGSIWIGVESLFTPLRKRQGRDVGEVFGELHAHGVETIGSWIGGWDFHDKTNIEEDLEYFISLEPTRSQLFPLYPPPGTSIYDRLVAEGRLPEIGADPSLARRYYGRTSGAQFGFPDWKKNFTEEEISAIVDGGNRRLYEYAGPSVMRSLRVQLNGYEFCKNSPHEVLRERRSELHEAHAMEAYPLIDICEFFAPNQKVAKDIQRIRRDYQRLFGEPTVEQRVMSKFAFLKGCLYKMTSTVGQPPPPAPPFRRYEYDRKPRGEKEMPYVVSYPRDDPRYERERGVYDNEMKLVGRVVELLAKGGSLEGAEPAVREIGGVFEDLGTLGRIAKLVDELGGEVGLAKGWLRSEVLKKLEGVDPTSEATSEDFLGG
jgi:putative component of membrane protein insertase Oxa1/YidC/SpoIIIJ protein YidD